MKSSVKALLGVGAVAVVSVAAFAGSAYTAERGAHWDRGFDHGRMDMRYGDARGPGGPGGPGGFMHRARFGPRFAHGQERFDRGHERFNAQMLELYDLNKDGKLTQDEIDKARADQLAKFDANKDGKLNLQEYQALWLDAMHERMVRAFQAHDSNGDGEITVAEFQKRF